MTGNSKENRSYDNPLTERYASPEMSFIFSPHFKFTTWRKLWIALAEAEKSLGLDISDAQITEMKNHVSDIDYELAAKYESKLRHDVMAHVHAYGDVCPLARPIIHLGATSAYVGDNTDIIQMKEACLLLLRRLSAIISVLRDFTVKHKDLPTLAFTHFQSAQPTTVGKRACLWILDFLMDFEAIEHFLSGLWLLGAKGTTGTQASFLSLFNGDSEKVAMLDRKTAEAMGFERTQPVSGQTYTRKIDANMAALLSGLAQSMHKLANDIRLLQHLKEIEEPFGKSQIGSSAMAYKRNPMRCERITSLSRYIISLASSPAMTASEQWFERTLDDSANKRLSIPQAFLAADACLVIALDVCSGLVVYPGVIARRLKEEMPFMATETILMEAVKKGGDRQAVHERIRVHSMETARRIKEEGKENDLLDRISSDNAIGLSSSDLAGILDASGFTGCASVQTTEFIAGHVDPLLKRAAAYGTAGAVELKV